MPDGTLTIPAVQEQTCPVKVSDIHLWDRWYTELYGSF